jgi:type VI secretion system secreted protein Hcp
MKALNPISKYLLPITTATTLLITPAAAYAAVDMFLLLDGINGETQDSSYSKEGGIDVLAWSNGLSNSGTTHMGAGGGAGRANFQDLSLTKYLDSSSPTLMLYASTGQHVDSATLIVRKAGEGQQNYFRVELTNVIVTSVSSGGSGGEDRLTENVTLNYAEIKWTYYPYDNRGTPGKPITVGYNIPENKVL